MSEAEVSQFLCVLIKMGEALQNSGAEVFRVEDTLNRIAAAYGAEEVDIFVITSSIVVTLTMPGLPPQTQTRRLRKSTGNNLLELEQLNALSRRICAEKPPVEEFQQQLSTILAQPGEPRLHLAGSVLAAASFAVFFGGSLWDGVLAGGVAVFICWMERWLAPFCLNGVAFQFIASFLSGMAALLCCRVCPLLHADMVLIGVIMLVLGSLSALGYGPLAGVTVFGMQFLDFFDFLTNSVMMPIAAITTCLLVSRVIGVKKIEEEVTLSGKPFRRKVIFNFMIQYLCPVFAAIILVSSVANALGWIAM